MSEEDKDSLLSSLHSAFQVLNERKANRDKVARLLETHDKLVAAAEEEVETLKKSHGLDRKDRASKEEMTAIRAKLRIVLREAQGEPMYPSQIAADAELSDIDQVRRVLREMIQTDGPVKNIQESRRESQYYWDSTWRSPSPNSHG